MAGGGGLEAEINGTISQIRREKNKFIQLIDTYFN